MAEGIRFGILGAAWIADRALIPAMQTARNATAVAIASRDPARAREMAQRHAVPTVHERYEALLDDRGIDAVYVALHNSAHREWVVRALEAGKHVLCEKPLGVNAGEVGEMSAAARAAERTLMEAIMYRFHPRMQELRAEVRDVRFLHSGFAFTVTDPRTYRLQAALGGGALLDVGCYTLDVARWFLGEPATVTSVIHYDGVDTSAATALRSTAGAEATTWASITAPEYQELVLVCADGTRRVRQPFTAWRDPHDPYVLMVEAFCDSVLTGSPPPRSLEDSLANAALIDRVRAAAVRT
jgi:xylose dehydrogenase (NAD/NADP)